MNSLMTLASKTMHLKRNEYLKIQGTIDTYIYYIENGSLRVYIMNGEEEQNIRFGYQSDFVAVLDSYLTLKPSPLYIQAIKKSTVRVITKSQVDEFIKNENQYHFWIKTLEDLVLQQMEREMDLLVYSPVERYQRVLARSPQLFQEIPNKHIANYLRMSPETLSRLKKS